MGFLEMLFGASKPAHAATWNLSFSEIDTSAPHWRESVRLAKCDCQAGEWAQFEQKLRNLPITRVKKAEQLLLQLHDGEQHSRASSLIAAMYYAAGRTSYNNGDFAELSRRAKIQLHPIPYLIALHSWRGLRDSFGTKATYFVRTGDRSYLCAGQTRYGH
jgi:hypothetical protein